MRAHFTKRSPTVFAFPTIASGLEFHPRERMVLTQMMDLVVQDFPFSSIASDLNEKGFRTREGKLWNQVSVFKMIPRLIEIGPGLFSTAEWAARRAKLFPARAKSR